MRAIDLFSGPGGLTLGMKAAGVEPILSVEMRPDTVETFRRHTPDIDHFCGDIRDFNFAKYRGTVELIYGGPPCQPFSTGGLRRTIDDKRNMIPAFLSAIKAVQPLAVLMENVPGLTVASRVSYLHEVLHAMNDLGYTPAYRVLNASHYGVPQNRRRLFIVCLRQRAFWFPKPTHGPGCQRPIVPSSTVLSIKKPLGEPPNCPVVYAKYPDLRPSPYAGQLYNGGGRPIDLTKPSPTILASAGGYKTAWIDTNGMAPRYHAHLRAGGTPWEGQVPGARRLTVEESALLQTFPKDMVFIGPRSKQYTQVGDAVPPVLAEVLARALVTQIRGNEPSEADSLHPVLESGLLW